MAQLSRLLMGLPLLLALLVAAEAAADPATGGSLSLAHYTSVFAFGDSLTDTGNGAVFPATAKGPPTRPPYGQTYFGHPSGRASDGRLIIDFLGTKLSIPPFFTCKCMQGSSQSVVHAVEELEVPLPTPYLAGRTAADFLDGANFALNGATALDPAFLASRGITSVVPISLGNETSWFMNVLQLLSSSGYGKNMIGQHSIFFLSFPFYKQD